MLDPWHDLPPRGGVGAELVGDHAPRAAALLMEKALQQSLGGFGAAANLNEFIEDVAVLVDSAPEVALLAADRDDDFVKMPDVAPTGVLALQAMGVLGAEFHGPAADGFVGEDDPAFEQHFLDEAQAEWEPEIEPDGVGDDLRWEAMALVADGRRFHGAEMAHSSLPTG